MYDKSCFGTYMYYNITALKKCIPSKGRQSILDEHFINYLIINKIHHVIKKYDVLLLLNICSSFNVFGEKKIILLRINFNPRTFYRFLVKQTRKPLNCLFNAPSYNFLSNEATNQLIIFYRFQYYCCFW